MTNDELIKHMQAERAARSPEDAKQHAENEVKSEAAFKPLMDALFASTAKDRENPNFDGWVRLCEILKKAKQDKRIASSAGASEFLEVVYELAADSLTLDSGDAAFEPITEELKALVKKLRKENRSR